MYGDAVPELLTNSSLLLGLDLLQSYNASFAPADLSRGDQQKAKLQISPLTCEIWPSETEFPNGSDHAVII